MFTYKFNGHYITALFYNNIYLHHEPMAMHTICGMVSTYIYIQIHY